MSSSLNPTWPVLTRYDQDHLAEIALPLGGIGTGTVSLGGRGELRDWETLHRPGKGFTPDNTFFAIRTASPDGDIHTRLLEGKLPPPYNAQEGRFAPNHGLPRFRECAFAAAYPFGQVSLADAEVPVRVRIDGFNPLVPADSHLSGIPVAILTYTIENIGPDPLEVSVSGCIQNFIGSDGTEGAPEGGVNQVRTGDGITGVVLRSETVDPASPRWGTMALATTADGAITTRTTWLTNAWNYGLLDYWDDLHDDGALDERPAGNDTVPMASLCVGTMIPAKESRAFTFLIGWHFPNRPAWTHPNTYSDEIIGNYYTTRYDDAWDVVTQTAAELPALEAETLDFVSAFCNSSLPDVVKEAALYNLSTLRSQTCFRTPDGHFFGWEGCMDRTGSCLGSCTHVWNYEQATPFLFGDLARSMREIEFLHATDANGLMSFRTLLPLARATEWNLAAADGQMGCLMKLYREWQLSGDDAWLRRLWPKAKDALAFTWIPGGWDADRDGVMEGCQHNTMDVEYYGPNPQMQFWYLGALRAMEELARHLGEIDYANDLRTLFERGRDWTSANLFNGEYFEHEIRPPMSVESIAPGLRHSGMGTRDLSEPDLQLGAGCLVDQLVGQVMANVCDLGDLGDPTQLESALQSVVTYNFRSSLAGHVNTMRTYAVNDDAALLMCSYPRGNRPKRPFPYYSEVMTGFEHTVAAHCFQNGDRESGLKVTKAIRDRFDGLTRNPFDEPECGHHYARAMASWASVLALSGFHYSVATGTMQFADLPGETHFWSTGYAWGTVAQSADGAVSFDVIGGTVKIDRLLIGNRDVTSTLTH